MHIETCRMARQHPTNTPCCLLPLPQMIAHHTAGGCNLRPGDLLATGTLSCEGPLGAGCLLEAT